MPVITEGMLRKLEKEGHLEKVRITEKDILTPSAREYLNVKKIDYRIKKSQEKTIKKKENGYYVLTLFQMDGTGLTEVEAKLNITESILKYMIVKND